MQLATRASYFHHLYFRLYSRVEFARTIAENISSSFDPTDIAIIALRDYISSEGFECVEIAARVLGRPTRK